MDQMGRASGIQHYTRRLQALRSSNLMASEFQGLMLRFPLKEGWLFGEDVKGIAEKCAVKNAVAHCITAAKPEQHQPAREYAGNKNTLKRDAGKWQSHQGHKQQQQQQQQQQNGTKSKQHFRTSNQSHNKQH